MCGIVGYKGYRNVKEVLIDGLKTLEYRGYDSAGISLMQNNKIKTIKSIGKIKFLEEKLKKTNILNSTMGIAHTRWATHGKVNELNSHPHSNGKITLVHNGIIENYKEIEKDLIKKGYKFKSETDSERIAALIDSYCKNNDILIAIEKSLKILRGSYSLLIMTEDDVENIYAVRKDAPLILGIGEKENFLSSDLSAIIPYTKKYIILENEEIVKFNEENPEIYFNGVIINKKINIASWNVEDAQKQGYKHFMLKEINDQIELSDKLLLKYISNGKINDDIVDISKYEKIDFVACGSAYFASLVGKYFLEKYLINKDFNCEFEVASEYRYKSHNYDRKTLVILISQSGETADTLACLRHAKENGIDTLAIVNVVSSSIAREAKYIIPMIAGPEICVATTKGYFSQTYIIILLILKALYKNKKITSNNFKDIIKEFNNLSSNVKKVINIKNYKKIAKSIYKEEDMYYIGRGKDNYICEEASLKLKEISYVHSECFKAGELKHGPISLITDNTPVICILTDEDLSEKMISNIVEASSRGGKAIILKTNKIKIDKSVYNYIIEVPDTTVFLEPLLIIVAAQLLAYEVANLRKCDIDKPRNLAKSVTVE